MLAPTALYAGGKLMRQTGGGNTLDFFYDESGHPYALKYNGTTYYYVTNLQGDVLHIVNNAGTAVVSYTYDPYGKPLTTTGSMASTLGAHNPLRYRGYVYDSETGFYYLQSRYYDPAIGRFINADSYASTGQGILGCNMFAYCRNNPACRKDISGTTDQATPDDDTDLLEEKKAYEGGKVINSDHSDSNSQPRGNGGQVKNNGGLRPGKPPVPRGSIRERVDSRSVKSQEFRDFIRSTGRTFRSSDWKYKMETWRAPGGGYFERHYWHNGKTGESYYHLR